MNYLDRLNDKQKEAVLHTEGPLLVLAGAGSGKTSMMTCRIAYLIDEKGVSPWNILAVTFTNKAAGEMRDRVESILDELGAGYETHNMWIATFHSACLRILRMHADVLGYDKDFVVYDTTDQKTVIKAVIKEQNIDDKKFSAQYLLSIISDCKEKCMDPEKYIKTVGEDFRTKVIYNAYRGYEATLRKNNAMDFDDLLLNAVRLFERDEAVLLKYQNRFKYIMVDEYQDTNTIQYKFVKYLAEAHNNICVVGDDDQCIYEWRGADIRNILDFERDFPGATVIKLEQNYRSYGNILDAAHCVISHNRGRKDKKLWTEKAAGEKIKYHRAEDERDEAKFIATEINFRMKHTPENRPEPFKFGNFAVLY
ncbi:MAG: UvrD-helicase domain-containing protein, partial [Firmicutes bacterium]|nr:UvrD-helicase domain-containing protein [Bacillota bacterium]